VALKDPFTETFLRTLRISVIGTLLCVVIAFPIAYFLAVRVSQRWKGVLLALVIVPFWTSFLVRTIAWRIVFAPKGFLSNWLQTIGVRAQNWARGSAMAMLLIGMILAAIAIIALVALGVRPLFRRRRRIDIDGVEVSARGRTWTPPPPVVAPAGVGAAGPVLDAPVAEPGTVVPVPTPPPRRRRRFE
jgi:hypothetical protein